MDIGADLRDSTLFGGLAAAFQWDETRGKLKSVVIYRTCIGTYYLTIIGSMAFRSGAYHK